MKATRCTTAPVPRPVRTSTAAARGGTQRPAGLRCCRRAAPDSVTAPPGGTRPPLHASGRRSTPATRARRANAPRWHAGPRATAATAASDEPYRSPQRQEPHRRLDRWQRDIRTDVDVAVVNYIDNFPNPLSAMPDALYIPGAPKREPLGRGGEGRQSEIRRPWPSEQTVSFGGPAVPSASGCCPMALAFLSMRSAAMHDSWG